ncbi:hypothetical protein [Acidiferrobacter sp.]
MSLSWQILLYIGALFFLTSCLSVVLSTSHNLSVEQAASYLVFSFRPGNIHVPRSDAVLKWLFDVFVIFITAIWQAIFIFRLMFSENSLRFSKKIAFYDYKCLKGGSSREDRPYLVFRILNDEDAAIFDIDIQVILKYFDKQSSTIQHYSLKVRNAKRAVLEPGNPFRIYIDVGLIEEAVDTKYLIHKGEVERDSDKDTQTIDLLEEGDDASTGQNVLVIIKSYDATLDKRSITTHEYEFSKRDVAIGRFENIRSIAECQAAGRSGLKLKKGWRDFYPSEIDAHFDKIVPCEGQGV